jgi:hypothetical protein
VREHFFHKVEKGRDNVEAFIKTPLSYSTQKTQIPPPLSLLEIPPPAYHPASSFSASKEEAERLWRSEKRISRKILINFNFLYSEEGFSRPASAYMVRVLTLRKKSWPCARLIFFSHQDEAEELV